MKTFFFYLSKYKSIGNILSYETLAILKLRDVLENFINWT